MIYLGKLFRMNTGYSTLRTYASPDKPQNTVSRV